MIPELHLLQPMKHVVFAVFCHYARVLKLSYDRICMHQQVCVMAPLGKYMTLFMLTKMVISLNKCPYVSW